MEYSLTKNIFVSVMVVVSVLILILMEYSLTSNGKLDRTVGQCLNPYSNGILSDIVSPKSRLSL